MTKLTDTQCVLLSSAAAREGGNLYPLPDTLTAPKPAIAKSIASLLQRGLAGQRGRCRCRARTEGPRRFAVTMGNVRTSSPLGGSPLVTI
jgi:hypothetical protein